MDYDVFVVSAALDELSKESATGSLDSAQIVVDAFHSLEPRDSIITKTTYTKEGNSTQGVTNVGEVSFKEKDETITNVRGVKYTRVGKWKVWRETDDKHKNISRIWFVHFLSQGEGESSRDREFFVEYDDALTPRAFCYIGDYEEVFHFWILTFYKQKTVIVFGESCYRSETRSATINF